MSAAIFTFGKYRGCLLSEIPIDYLEWAAENITFRSAFLNMRSTRRSIWPTKS